MRGSIEDREQELRSELKRAYEEYLHAEGKEKRQAKAAYVARLVAFEDFAFRCVHTKEFERAYGNA